MVGLYEKYIPDDTGVGTAFPAASAAALALASVSAFLAPCSFFQASSRANRAFFFSSSSEETAGVGGAAWVEEFDDGAGLAGEARGGDLERDLR